MFDRLGVPEWDPGRGARPRTTLGREELRASVRWEVERLLNTRVPLQFDVLTRARRSILDYGFPDLAPVAEGAAGETERFARAVERSIEAFEPRLANVDVSIVGPTRQRRGIGIEVSADIVIEGVTEPIRFPVWFASDGRSEDDG